jgi:hypothetical protein
MPHPVVYNGNQDDDLTRSIDVVHIEPSIREGVHLVSSLYGSDASAPIYRYPPQNVTAPYITGPEQIPGTLTCHSGQWVASPAAVMSYQWMADGVDIPNATGPTWETSEAYDNTVITCEVVGRNALGEDYALTSNSIPISLIEPIVAEDLYFGLVSGIAAKQDLTLQDKREVVITGAAAPGRTDINRSVAYFMTGRAADQRSDINGVNVPIITGIEQKELLNVQNAEAIAVISSDAGTPLVENVPQPMNLKNNNADIGLGGWEVFGGANYHTDRSYNDGYCFWGGEDVDAGQANMPYSYMWQDVEIFPVWETDVDAGLTHVDIFWMQNSWETKDQANIKLAFLDVNKNVLANHSGAGMWASPANVWFPRESSAPIPANTRFIQIIPEFNLVEGENLNAYIDYMRMDIRKGDRLNARSYGPTFDRWRLRFTQANAYSGVALSELEFRDSIGGVDLCTGGLELAGSEGAGGLAMYAFDDLRNGAYWAGEQNGVANGTAWLGYDMGTPVKPAEVDITARAGSDSLQMGTSFYLEGSDDGNLWTKVQYFPDIGTFSSGQQRQFVVLDGAFPYISDTWVSNDFFRRTDNRDDKPMKGNQYQARARMNIQKIRARVQANNATVFPYRLALVRHDYSYAGGMVTEVIEEFSGNTNGVSEWLEHTLTVPAEIEVGEFFSVIFIDDDAENNTVDPNEGRIWYFDNVVDGGQGVTSTAWHTRVAGWANSDPTLRIGTTSSYSFDYYYAVDFTGTVF